MAELVAILRTIEGMPAGAVELIARAVWRSVPGHPTPRKLWGRAARIAEALLMWVRAAEGLPADDPRTLALAHIAALAPEGEGLGYSALVLLGVDALRAEGLPLYSSRRSQKRGALEIMGDVLYCVWRKPDPRSRDLRRSAGSLAAVYWKAKKAKGAELLRLASNAATNERAFIWIPARPAPRGRNF